MYSEMRKQANSDVISERGEAQKVTTEAYKANFDKIFRKRYNTTHEEFTSNGRIEQEQ